MDELFRKNKYQEYVKLINTAKEEVKSNMFDTGVRNKTNAILEELKEKEDANQLNTAILLLAIPLVILMVYQYIQYGFTLRTFPIVLILGFFFFYRSIMRSSTVESVMKGRLLDKFPEEGKPQMNAKLDYILSGIEIKQSRVRMTRIFYTVFFPFLMIYVTEMIKGRFDTKWYIIGLLLSFLIGGYFWWKYFQDDYEDLDDKKDSIVDIQRKLNSNT